MFNHLLQHNARMECGTRKEQEGLTRLYVCLCSTNIIQLQRNGEELQPDNKKKPTSNSQSEHGRAHDILQVQFCYFAIQELSTKNSPTGLERESMRLSILQWKSSTRAKEVNVIKKGTVRWTVSKSGTSISTYPELTDYYPWVGCLREQHSDVAKCAKRGHQLSPVPIRYHEVQAKLKHCFLPMQGLFIRKGQKES